MKYHYEYVIVREEDAGAVLDGLLKAGCNFALDRLPFNKCQIVVKDEGHFKRLGIEGVIKMPLPTRYSI